MRLFSASLSLSLSLYVSTAKNIISCRAFGLIAQTAPSISRRGWNVSYKGGRSYDAPREFAGGGEKERERDRSPAETSLLEVSLRLLALAR